ncbi:GIY-YIG nuclease family protein [Reyranella aquatilis]|uniref:GIY-YIG nuclease family protein n=1 Tax=Reyranella aquatilis TaxID=2035356 RepID=A0ABS8KTS8_9HYPH|nr:GIY-YIG nuclease family protein [Reyranella aquatilis]MCC8429162.1 GIY-YIG nuclease family protein [Reyranella aquatilis]
MARFTDEDDALLGELGVEVETKKHARHTPREERIIAGFEEIQRFVDQHGRAPEHGEERDIFERLYAVRLDRLRAQDDCRALIEPLDHQGLLAEGKRPRPGFSEAIDDDALLEQLGVTATTPSDISQLRHVRSAVERQEAEEIANRQKCEDFDRFKPLFQQVQAELDSGFRRTRPFELKAEIEAGGWFIVGGQKAYVATVGDIFTNPQGRTDARLRVIFDNGTESNMLMRSLQRALNKDEAGRRITAPVAGPLFAGEAAEGDQASGTIYVLRSKSDHPTVAANRNLVHKIGVTNLSVERRVAGARLQPTFLMADVEVIATYKLFNLGRSRLENLIHRIFAPARLEIEILDRFGRPFVPEEWFFVPLKAINDAVEKIMNGTIGQYVYDPKQASLVQVPNLSSSDRSPPP